MGLNAPFTTYNPPETTGPDQIGIYELGWSADTETGYRVVYIGSGKISRRLRTHWNSKKTWTVYRCEITNCRRRAHERERREQRRFIDHHDRLPRYNKQIGDLVIDPHF